MHKLDFCCGSIFVIHESEKGSIKERWTDDGPWASDFCSGCMFSILEIRMEE
jgi:hypothetical protein